MTAEQLAPITTVEQLSEALDTGATFGQLCEAVHEDVLAAVGQALAAHVANVRTVLIRHVTDGATVAATSTEALRMFRLLLLDEQRARRTIARNAARRAERTGG